MVEEAQARVDHADAVLATQLDAATQAYTQAEAIYARHGVPPAYRNRVRARLNLGQLSYLNADPAGFEHFDYVMDHGSPEERLEVLGLATSLAHDRLAEDGPERALAWAERGLAELQAQPQAATRATHDIELAVGSVLIKLDDPRGEDLLRSARTLARSLPVDVATMTEQTWIDHLWGSERCDEARAQLDELDTLVASLASPLPGWDDWRAFFRTESCPASPATASPTLDPH